MKTNRLLILICAALFFGACDKNDNPSEPEVTEPVEGMFVLTAKKGLAGADLMYTNSSLDGVLTTTGRGIEQNGASRTYLTHNGLIYSFMFGGSAPGAVTAYKINASKELEKVTDFQTETMHAFGTMGDDILMMKNAWQPEEEFNSWYRLDTKTLQIVARGEINSNKLAGNGGKAFFTDLKKVGNKLFASYWNIESARTFRSASPDSTMIAVYSYPEMKFEKVIRDARTGSIGAYFRSGMEVDELGDLYVLGTKLGPDKTGAYSKKTPAAFMKIKKGTTEYDKSYFFDITAASGGKYVFQKLYLGKGNFLLTMGNNPDSYGTTMGLTNPISFAIVNVYNSTYKAVTGAPDPSSIYRTTEYSNNYSPLDGKTGYLGINIIDMTTFSISGIVYKFDAETATMTPSLTLDSPGGFTSLDWLPVSK
ncbi:MULTISPECIES: DUF4374 domain-containing protein [Flavobacterium]|uniref:DUF4374 domain-containing protein n=1 Tax=Flavobacterium TaxID=237 RepID=UPI001182F8C7|nr:MULTISPECIES: DUF4374 domain-containing protein [Flavobacterium]MCR4029598.1 DUF4374 domain-containing protein [Flavobacterium panacis]